MKLPVLLSSSSLCLAFGAIILSSCSAVHSMPGGSDYVFKKDSTSPDHRYGVMVPVFRFDGPDVKDPQDRLVDLKSRKVVAVIPGDFPAYDRGLNHHGAGIACWSEDSSVLLWAVGGKWTWDNLALVKIQNGKARWQLDVIQTARREILERTRKSRPERYAAVKKKHGDSSFDGFSMDFHVECVRWEIREEAPVSLPLEVEVNLSSTPPNIVEGEPDSLDSYMDGLVNEDGTFVVKSFHLGSRPGRGEQG